MKIILHDQDTEIGHEKRSQGSERPAYIDEMLRRVEEQDFDRAADPDEMAKLCPGNPESGVDGTDIALEVRLKVIPTVKGEHPLADVVAAPDELIVTVKRLRKAGVAK